MPKKLKEQTEKVLHTAKILTRDKDLKQTPQELQVIEDKLIVWLRLSEGASEAEIKEKVRIFREGVGLPTETPQEKRAKVIIQELREWIASQQGEFHIRDLYNELPEYSKTGPDKRYISTCLARLVKARTLDKDGKYGVYRKVDKHLETIDFINVKADPVDLWLPFGITAASDEEGPGLINLYHGNIVVIAGEKDAGKSTVCYNIAKENMNTWEVHVFDSEAGAEELNIRLSKFDMDIYDWGKVSFYERYKDWSHVIKQGKGVLNIIDFMECYDEFYKMGGWISDIHRNLKGALAVVAVQKKRGVDFPRGGEGVFEKARLALLMGRGKMTIAAAKSFVDRNPRDFKCDFKIVDGCHLIQSSPWGKEDQWNPK